MNERQALGSVILVGALIILPGLCVQQLESGDETRVAGIAAEMFINGDYLIPRLNGTPFLEYPPLFYWSVSFCYGLFGITDFSAKLPSVLSAVGCGVLLFFLARKMRYSITGALLSSVMLMTSAQFFGNSRKCTVDMMLAFFILFSVYQFYCLVIATARGKSSLHFLLFILGIAGGIYTKGLLGLCIPLAALGSWLVLGDLVKHRIAWKHYILLFLGAFFLLSLEAPGMSCFTVRAVNSCSTRRFS